MTPLQEAVKTVLGLWHHPERWTNREMTVAMRLMQEAYEGEILSPKS